MVMSAIRRHWTSADVRVLINESARTWPRYELIDGELLVTPAPGGSHQLAVQELLVLLRAYLQQEQIAVAFLSPADLELRPGTITQPDLFVVPAVGANSTDGKFRWKNVSSLLLAIEVVSPGSVRTDRVAKREFYSNVGVPDYVVVDVEARIFEHWRTKDDTPVVIRDEFVWHPRGARQPLTVTLPEFFDRIGAMLRLLDQEP